MLKQINATLFTDKADKVWSYSKGTFTLKCQGKVSFKTEAAEQVNLWLEMYKATRSIKVNLMAQVEQADSDLVRFERLSYALVNNADNHRLESYTSGEWAVFHKNTRLIKTDSIVCILSVLEAVVNDAEASQ